MLLLPWQTAQFAPALTTCDFPHGFLARGIDDGVITTDRALTIPTVSFSDSVVGVGGIAVVTVVGIGGGGGGGVTGGGLVEVAPE